MGFPRQECWSELPFSPPWDIPDRGMNLSLLHCMQIFFQTLIEYLNQKIGKNGEDLTMTNSQLDPMDICRTFPQIKPNMYSFQMHEEHLLR